MTELLWIRLKTLVWFLAFPLVFLGWLPWWLSHRFDGPFTWEGLLAQWLGLWLMLNGLGLAGWCVQLFNVQGRGTPLPLDPPKRFVAAGPYLWVRNPMAIGMFLLVAGQACLYRSRAVLLYLIAVTVLMHAFVVLVEEPQLARRFGNAYLAYKRQVPRWLPRLTAVSKGDHSSTASPIFGARSGQTR